MGQMPTVQEGDLDAFQYAFDIHGYCIIQNVLDAETLRRMNALIDEVAATQPRFYVTPKAEGGQGDRFGFEELARRSEARIFTEQMADVAVLGVLRVCIGDWLRLDHAYGIAMDADWDGTENLHGGARTDQGEHAYQWHQGRMYNGLVGCMYALHDVNPGDGGFVIVPGSHKANHGPYTPDLNSPLVVNPNLRAGDLCIFTEALVHGTIKWRSAKPRRSLLYKYSPGYSCWMPDEQLAPLRSLASTELQHQLLRSPSVGALASEAVGGPLRAALRLPEPGRWGSADMDTQMRREAARLAWSSKL